MTLKRRKKMDKDESSTETETPKIEDAISRAKTDPRLALTMLLERVETLEENKMDMPIEEDAEYTEVAELSDVRDEGGVCSEDEAPTLEHVLSAESPGVKGG